MLKWDPFSVWLLPCVNKRPALNEAELWIWFLLQSFTALCHSPWVFGPVAWSMWCTAPVASISSTLGFLGYVSDSIIQCYSYNFYSKYYFCLHRATTLFTPFFIRVKIKYYSSYCTIMSFDLGYFIFHLKKIQKDAKTQTHALISSPISAPFKFGYNLEKKHQEFPYLSCTLNTTSFSFLKPSLHLKWL